MDENQHETRPRWAVKMDDFHRRYRKPEKPRKNRTGECIVGIIWNIIWLWVVNKVPSWHIDFINDHYIVVLTVLNITIVVQIIGFFIMLIFDIRMIRHLCRMGMEAANFVSLIVIYYVYPFDFSGYHFSHTIDILLPIFLVIGMAVSVLKVLSNAWKLIFSRD